MKEIQELIDKINEIKYKKSDTIVNIDKEEVESNILASKKKEKNIKLILDSNYIIKNGYKYKIKQSLIKRLGLITFLIITSIISILFFTLIEVTASTLLLYAISIIVSLIGSTATNRYKKRMLKENSLLKPYYDTYKNTKLTREQIEKDLELTQRIIEENNKTLEEIKKDQDYIERLNKISELLQTLQKEENKTLNKSLVDELEDLSIINKEEKKLLKK